MESCKTIDGKKKVVKPVSRRYKKRESVQAKVDKMREKWLSGLEDPDKKMQNLVYYNIELMKELAIVKSALEHNGICLFQESPTVFKILKIDDNCTVFHTCDKD